MSVPFTRTLPYVLRDQLNETSVAATLIIAEVVSAPDGDHVTVRIQGTNITVPRLKSFTPVTAGRPCYLLASPALILAIGAI